MNYSICFGMARRLSFENKSLGPMRIPGCASRSFVGRNFILSFGIPWNLGKT